MLVWPSLALAAELRVYTPDATARAGVRTTVELAVADARGPVTGAVLEVVPRAGRLAGPVVEVGPGRYDVPWVAPAGTTEEVFTVRFGGEGPYSLHLPVESLVPAPLGAPHDQDVSPGAGRIELKYPSTDPPAPEDVVIGVTEGRVLSVTRETDGLDVVVTPSEDTNARIVHVAVWDRRVPDRMPVFGAARVRVRRTGTVTVEPGSTVSVRVGGRTYGPFSAGSDGQAGIAFEAWPGETTYDVVATDAAGNSSRVTSSLGGDLGRPVVLALTATETDRASVLLAAWSGNGAAAALPTPTCRAGSSARTDAVALARGLWRYDIDAVHDLALFDLRVECSVGDSALPLRIDVGSPLPARVDLKAWPDSLAADFPVAQVQAALLDARGDRLPPDGLLVTADHGRLTVTPTPDSLRADYAGEAAVAAGGDELHAAWNLPAGRGDPWTIRVWGRHRDGDVDVLGRVLDRSGSPVAGRVVQVDAGAAAIEATTDARGWLRATLPASTLPVEVVHVTADHAHGAAAVFIGQTALPDPDLPDLRAETALPLRAGRARTIVVEGPETPLPTGAGDGTPIRVRVLDTSGNPVSGEAVTVEADYGSVTATTTSGDGAWTATYTPPRALVDRVVRITASAGGATGSTNVHLIPRPVRGGVSAEVGWLANFAAISAPVATIHVDWRLPVFPVVGLRAGLNAYTQSSDVEGSGGTVTVASEFFPVELGLLGAQRWTRASLGAGIAAVLVPYGQRVEYGSRVVVDGAGIAPPGVSLSVEGAWRIGMSELVLDARYLVLPSPTGVVTYESSVGGAALSAGYRVLY